MRACGRPPERSGAAGAPRRSAKRSQIVTLSNASALSYAERVAWGKRLFAGDSPGADEGAASRQP